MVKVLGALIILVLATAFAAACGARSQLPAWGDGSGPASSAFCSRAEYSSGYEELSIYVLLDKSASMEADDKWVQATTALATFVDDPSAAGLSIGLQLFPQGSSCEADKYALPLVAISPLPENAAAIKSALSGQIPAGETPTALALRGGIEYARAKLLAEPSHAIAMAIITDGAPNACNSTTPEVAEIAAQGAAGSPQVLTFVIGLETGYTNSLALIAEAGGTGDLILVGSEGTAQGLVEALRALRDELVSCRFAVPPAYGHEVTANDVSVQILLGADDVVVLQRKASVESCSGGHGFFLDDPQAPKRVQLCPASCDLVHSLDSSRVLVRAGCGAGEKPSEELDGGSEECGGAVTISCVKDCGSGQYVTPICQGGWWVCPPGTVSTTICKQCPPVPHGCCLANGNLGAASCIDGNWQCPPDAVLFGEGQCMPPAVCAALLPCASASYCSVPDFSCGTGSTSGSCVAKPASCSPSDQPPVCACNGQTYSSACAARAAGFDLSLGKPCQEPAGTFSCGPLFCSIANQICRKTVELAEPSPDRYDCIAKPPSCPTGCGCDLCETCPQGKTCGEACSGGEFGGVQLNCTQI